MSRLWGIGTPPAVLGTVRALFAKGWTSGQIAAEINTPEWRLRNREAAFHRPLDADDVAAIVESERLWLPRPQDTDGP